MSAQLRLHRLAFPVTNLGPGRRLGIWTQGCLLNCPGCCSPEAQPTAGGSAQSVERWVSQIIRVVKETPRGITISGGEPTLQASAVVELIRSLRSVFSDVDILLFSGLSWSNFRQSHSDLAEHCDVIVSEPYLADVPPVTCLHGSGNQTVHLLTPLAKRRFMRSLARREASPLVITSISDRHFSAIGIPGKMNQLETALAHRGILLEPLPRRD